MHRYCAYQNDSRSILENSHAAFLYIIQKQPSTFGEKMENPLSSQNQLTNPLTLCYNRGKLWYLKTNQAP